LTDHFSSSLLDKAKVLLSFQNLHMHVQLDKIIKIICSGLSEKTSGATIWDAFGESAGQKETKKLKKKNLSGHVPQTISECMYLI
jgi:hypothetical protein